MRTAVLRFASACSITLLATLAPLAANAAPASDAQRPELAYLKQVNAWRPPSDPQLLFLLMAQFTNAGRQAEGIEFMRSALERFGDRIDGRQRALYLLALASLRASHAGEVSLFARIGWVRETVGMLDEAKRLTGNRAFVARWMSGVVRAQLPSFFGERDAALADLAWCEANAAQAPHPGWLREVYFRLAALYRDRGESAQAQRYQDASGFAAGAKPVVFTTPFAEDPVAGHTFSARALKEVVPGTVYALSGFEFTEYYFVVSADRRELIAIDAGTRADAARAAHEALLARVPGLPPLTTVLITHAHWDHVGGQGYFRGLHPAPRFIGRANYRDELAKGELANPATLKRFFGATFDPAAVQDYRPDVAIDRPTDLVVGGTRFQLLPARGGETEDALLVHMPDAGVLFAGDILMPYIGAPFSEEGSVHGLLAAIDQVRALEPAHLLHGHEPLTRVFNSVAMLADLHGQVAWLRTAVLQAIRSGQPRAAIHAANLIPPLLERSDSSVHLAYLLLRENVINRVFDQSSGYWQNGLAGLDALGDSDRGEAVLDYLGVSEAQLARAAERMVADGKHELAAELLRWTSERFPDDARLQAARKLAHLKLMEKYQEFNPFKFILYAGEIDQPARAIERTGPPAATSTAGR